MEARTVSPNAVVPEVTTFPYSEVILERLYDGKNHGRLVKHINQRMKTTPDAIRESWVRCLMKRLWSLKEPRDTKKASDLLCMVTTSMKFTDRQQQEVEKLRWYTRPQGMVVQSIYKRLDSVPARATMSSVSSGSRAGTSGHQRDDSVQRSASGAPSGISDTHQSNSKDERGAPGAPDSKDCQPDSVHKGSKGTLETCQAARVMRMVKEVDEQGHDSARQERPREPFKEIPVSQEPDNRVLESVQPAVASSGTTRQEDTFQSHDSQEPDFTVVNSVQLAAHESAISTMSAQLGPQLQDTFQSWSQSAKSSVADNDHVYAFTLCRMLNETFKIYFEKFAGFSLDLVRSLLLMVTKTDTCGFEQFSQLWARLSLLKSVFTEFTYEGAASLTELRDMLQMLGYRVGDQVLQILFKRYKSENETLHFQDFVACCLRLRILVNYHSDMKAISFQNVVSLDRFLNDLLVL